MSIGVDTDQVSRRPVFADHLHTYNIEIKEMLDPDSSYDGSGMIHNPIDQALEILESSGVRYNRLPDDRSVVEALSEDPDDLKSAYESLRVPLMTAIVAEDYDFDPLVYEKDWVQEIAAELEEFSSDLNSLQDY